MEAQADLFFPSSLALDPSGKRLFVGAWGSIYRSDDGGQTWAQFKEGLPSTAGVANNCLFFDSTDQTLYAGTYGGGLFQLKGGDWEGLFAGSSGLGVMNGGGGVRYVKGRTKELFIGVDGAGLLRSEDEGLTWERASNGIPTLEILNFRFDPNDTERIYVATGVGGYRSDDGSRAWSLVTGGTGQANIKDFLIHPGDSQRIIVATDGGGPFKSADGGTTWAAAGSGPEISRAFRLAMNAKTGRIFLGTVDSGVFVSDDAAVTWRPSSVGMVLNGSGRWDNAIRCIVVDGEQGVVFVGVYNGGVFMSRNDGESWQSIGDALPSESIGALHLTDGRRLLAGTGAGVYELNY